MKTIDQILDENLDVVNELINAAFREGCGSLEVGPLVGERLSRYAEKAIFARTKVNATTYRMGIKLSQTPEERDLRHHKAPGSKRNKSEPK